MPEYLTTRELAELLRIKERKVYDLAASGEVPVSKAMGKLLFPRSAIEAWLAERSSGLDRVARTSLPAVVLGSHDPLLDWALRESHCHLATYLDGSSDGLDRFANREGIAAGLHLHDGAGGWNVEIVRQRCATMPVVLLEWARRRRGLIIAPGLEKKIRTIADLAGRRLVPRQPESGAQILLDHILAKSGLDVGKVTLTAAARNEFDAALAVSEGKADAAFGLAAIAAQMRLPFVAIVEERFDLLVDRRAWFEPPLQTLHRFCQTDAFKSRAAELAGYDVTGLATVHFNGA